MNALAIIGIMLNFLKVWKNILDLGIRFEIARRDRTDIEKRKMSV